jgi:hypothetical protein
MRDVPAFMYDSGMDQRSVTMIRDALDIYVTTAQEHGLGEEKSDFRILAHARRLGCTLIVRDKGFKHLHTRLESLELSHAGIVWAKKYLPPERMLAFAAQWVSLSIEKEIPNVFYYRYWEVR